MINVIFIEITFLKKKHTHTEVIGPKGQVWFAPSMIGLSGGNQSAPWREEWQNKYGRQVSGYGSLFIAELKEPYTLYPKEVGCFESGRYNVEKQRQCYGGLHSYYVREANSSFDEIQRWDKDTPLELNANDIIDFALYSIAEIDSESGWSFLGEADKYVSHSPTRFFSVTVSPDGGEMRVIATSGDSGDNFESIGAKITNPHTLQIREKENARFLNAEDEEETITTAFVDPKGQVRLVTCTLAGGKRGQLRHVMIVQNFENGYCQY